MNYAQSFISFFRKNKSYQRTQFNISASGVRMVEKNLLNPDRSKNIKSNARFGVIIFELLKLFLKETSDRSNGKTQVNEPEDYISSEFTLNSELYTKLLQTQNSILNMRLSKIKEHSAKIAKFLLVNPAINRASSKLFFNDSLEHTEAQILDFIEKIIREEVSVLVTLQQGQEKVICFKDGSTINATPGIINFVNLINEFVTTILNPRNPLLVKSGEKYQPNFFASLTEMYEIFPEVYSLDIDSLVFENSHHETHSSNENTGKTSKNTESAFKPAIFNKEQVEEIMQSEELDTQKILNLLHINADHFKIDGVNIGLLELLINIIEGCAEEVNGFVFKNNLLSLPHNLFNYGLDYLRAQLEKYYLDQNKVLLQTENVSFEINGIKVRMSKETCFEILKKIRDREDEVRKEELYLFMRHAWFFSNPTEFNSTYSTDQFGIINNNIDLDQIENLILRYVVIMEKFDSETVSKICKEITDFYQLNGLTTQEIKIVPADKSKSGVSFVQLSFGVEKNSRTSIIVQINSFSNYTAQKQDSLNHLKRKKIFEQVEKIAKSVGMFENIKSDIINLTLTEFREKYNNSALGVSENREIIEFKQQYDESIALSKKLYTNPFLKFDESIQLVEALSQMFRDTKICLVST